MTICPSCGQQNPAAARFCLACGTPLAEEEATRREVRKMVTVVFSTSRAPPRWAAAYAEGRTGARCTGAELQWQVRALGRLRTRFAQGTAQACALGITRRNGHPTDAHQWCVDVTLGPAS